MLYLIELDSLFSLIISIDSMYIHFEHAIIESKINNYNLGLNFLNYSNF